MSLGQEADLTFDQFKEEWLQDVLEGDPSAVEKGHRFATKLIKQWLSITDDDDDFIVCDGPGDGGIDIAYLQRAENSSDDIASGEIEGDIWYLVQSKYGTAYQGTSTLFEEGRKVFDTLSGTTRRRLANTTHDLLERISQFRKRSSDHDRIHLVFATEDSLGDSDRGALRELSILGNDRFPNLIEIEAVSLRTLWEEAQPDAPEPVTLNLNADLAGSSDTVRIGSIPIKSLYQFLKNYESKTGNLDRLYEENVRQFLGARKKINRRMASTLENDPERFGLFNNGITIVAEEATQLEDSDWRLTNPSIVNGCQTTRTIWNVLKTRLDSGGTGASTDDWEERLDQGIVVAKLVENRNPSLIRDVVRFTNSQNAVRDQDFVALENDYREWKQGFERDFQIFLEIRRGAWDAYNARNKGKPDRFTSHANAFELIKVIGAGWHEIPGTAFRTNKAFLPGEDTFKNITDKGNPAGEFNHRDLFAAHIIKKQGERLQFGRNAQASRRLTKFLFYMLAVRILRYVLSQNEHDTTNKGVVDAIIKLEAYGDTSDATHPLNEVGNLAAGAIDSYMDDSPGSTGTSIYGEESYVNKHDRNVNSFLKWDGLGKADETPNLSTVLSHRYYIATQPLPGRPSLVDSVFEVLRN